MTDIDLSPAPAPRRPLVAALLSLALPGLGQLYAGALDKGLWTFLAFAAVGAPGGVLATLYAPAPAMLPLLAATALATLGIWIWSMRDAWRAAAAQEAPRRAWQVPGLFALLFVLGATALWFGLVDGMNAHLVRSFVTPADSMAPTLLRGDYFFVDLRYNCPLCKGRVARGDVGVFVYPNDRTFYYVKRVLGLPGDRIVLRGRALFVNDERISGAETREADRIIVAEQSGGHGWRAQWTADQPAADAEWTVPPAAVFVLGDNRTDSRDSRSFGFVPLADLVGKARQIWFSKGPAGPRWERSGKTVE